MFDVNLFTNQVVQIKSTDVYFTQFEETSWVMFLFSSFIYLYIFFIYQVYSEI